MSHEQPKGDVRKALGEMHKAFFSQPEKAEKKIKSPQLPFAKRHGPRSKTAPVDPITNRYGTGRSALRHSPPED